MEEISYLTLNEEIYIIILVNTIKAFDKIKHSFLILKKIHLVNQKELSEYFEKSVINIILNGECANIVRKSGAK